MESGSIEDLKARLGDLPQSGVFRPSAGPKELVAQLLERLKEERAGLPAEVAFQLVDAAFQLSLMTDEARHLRFTAYLPPDDLPVRERLLQVPFREFRFKPSEVRGLGPAIPPAPYALVVMAVHAKLYCCGVARGSSGGPAEGLGWDGLYVTIHGPGHLSVLHQGAGRVHLELRDGSIESRPDLHESGAFNAVCVRAARRVLEEDGPEVEVGLLTEALRVQLGTLLGHALDMRHGGAFLVVPRDLVSMLQDTEVRYGSRGPDLGRAMAEALALPDGHPRRAPAREQALSRARAVAQLSAVDGSVLLDDGLRAVGFGTILRFGDLPVCRRVDKYESVTSRAPAERDRPLVDVTARGTRHQSSAWFCATHPGSTAFVVSQDGELRAFEHHDEKTVWVCGPLATHLR
jgi:Probable sensor domain DACNV